MELLVPHLDMAVLVVLDTIIHLVVLIGMALVDQVVLAGTGAQGSDGVSGGGTLGVFARTIDSDITISKW